MGRQVRDTETLNRIERLANEFVWQNGWLGVLGISKTLVASKKEFKRLESVFQENLAEMRRYSELINQAIKRQNPNGSEAQKYRYEFSKLAAKNERIKREIKQYMNTHFSAL